MVDQRHHEEQIAANQAGQANLIRAKKAEQALAAEREMRSTERRMRDKAEARAMLADAALNALSWLHQVAGGDGKASVADVESHVIKAMRDTKSERYAAIERAKRAEAHRDDAEREVEGLRAFLSGERSRYAELMKSFQIEEARALKAEKEASRLRTEVERLKSKLHDIALRGDRLEAETLRADNAVAGWKRVNDRISNALSILKDLESSVAINGSSPEIVAPALQRVISAMKDS